MYDPKEILSPEEIGQRLRALREMFGMSGASVAQACGLDQSNYSKIERGAVNLTVQHAASLCRLYGVDLNYIYLGDPSNGPTVTPDAPNGD